MRKFSVVLVLLVVLFMTGCDKKKTLTCSKTEDSTGMDITTTTTTNFINDSISTLNMNIDIKLDSNYVKYADTIKSSLENEYSSYKNTKGVSYKTTVNNDVVNLNLVVDNNIITKKTRKALKLDGNESYDANKKSLEKDGYTCK